MADNNLSQLTDMMMVNPWMFDPTQKSNQFSLYNNAPLPYPPTYNTGAGGPVNAATGQPIQSFQDWQKANPGGVTLNATPSQPAQAQQVTQRGIQNMAADPSGFGMLQMLMGGPGGQPMLPGDPNTVIPQLQNVASQLPWAHGMQGAAGAQGGPAAAPQGGGPPNNWQAAINALSNPGNPVTQGANVPLAQGYQPAGGVNQAWLNQAGAGQGMNQNFLSALRGIQGR